MKYTNTQKRGADRRENPLFRDLLVMAQDDDADEEREAEEERKKRGETDVQRG